MIKICKVSKYFKSGNNKVKAVDNISLELPKNGLVALLGPSGCGKTTLLNIIGGLDKPKKGKVYVNDMLISSKFSCKVDKVRNNNIGYIFQDYKLINNLTVFENVEIVLKMIGVKNKKEREKRVNFVLEKVGMYRYRRRPSYMLSGGERQRVAIARALVKNPDIILADEPTGNLDSRNSLEIMKIISSIAKDRLVVLVTHEKSLAKFYATRIVSLEDGKIVSDELNKEIDDLDYVIDNNVYLKDFDVIEHISRDNYDINIYNNNDDKLEFDVVVKNGNIYIKSSQKIEVVDEHSSIEFIDDHYKKLSKKELLEFHFTLDGVISDNKKKYSSIFNPFTFIKNGFAKVFKYTFIRKVLLIGFFVSSAFTLFAFGAIVGINKYEEKDFLSQDRNNVTATTNVSSASYDNITLNENVLLALPYGGNLSMDVFLEKFSQVQFYSQFNLSIAPLSLVSEDKIIAGNMPSNPNEVLIDKYYIDNLIENSPDFKMVGVVSYEDFIGISFGSPMQSNSEFLEYTISGVYDGNNVSLYVDENSIPNLFSIANSGGSELFLNYAAYSNNIILESGRMPENNYEIILHSNFKEQYKNNNIFSLENVDYTIVGYFDNNEFNNNFFVNSDTLYYKLFKETNKLTVYSMDKSSVIDDLKNMNINAIDSYVAAENSFVISREENITQITIIAAITLGISVIQIFLIVRASFLSRVKEVGIYRAIGVKKSDVYKMFASEIIAITILVNIPGLIIMTYILRNVEFINSFVDTSNLIILASLIFVFIINIVFGLLPVFGTIRKRPAYILARHDIE